MGWFESPRYPGVMLGDQAFDLAYYFLKELAQAYQQQFQRNPSLEEVTVLLQISLYANGSDLVAGLERKLVTNVSVKTISKKKDQPFATGDIFAVPLGDGRFAFGRILNTNPTLGHLVEIFREVGRGSPQPPERMKRLFGPVPVLGLAWKQWRWPIVSHREGYEMTPEDTATEFVSGSPSLGFKVVNYKNKILREASPEDKEILEQFSIWQPTQLEKRIKRELQNLN